MKKNRYIPFGYAMKNGQIILHKQEAPAVKIIFSHYLLGESLQSIAQTLAAQGPAYNEGKVWNKHMIKRILEDKRYLGEAEYPPLVSTVDFGQANRSKANRNTSTPIPVASAVSALKAKTVCGTCGSGFQRRSTGRWYCKSQGCGTDIPITDRYLLDTVVEILNQAIDTPFLLEQPGQLPHAPNLEITRLENEIGRELDTTGIDGGAVKALLFSCAATKYTVIREEMPSLQTLFSGRLPMMELDFTFFDQTVEQVVVAKDGDITLHMTDGTRLTFTHPNTITRSA